MSPKSTITFAAALAVGVACVSPVLAQSVAEAPAIYRGPFTCAAKYPGSFLDLATAACWQCPATHPNRTIFMPVTVGNACERPAQTLYRKAYGPENPTGLIGTNCRSGWFLHWDRKCYSCGSGYVRTAEPNIAHARACARVIPAAWTTATRMGVEGCPAGAFRNGLTANCYACPPDYSRNAVVADDLTKVNACTRISTGAQDETKAKFNAQNSTHTATRDNLGGISGSLATFDPNNIAFDAPARLGMRLALDKEMMTGRPFNAITLLVSGSAAVGVGYAHGFGYVMAYDNGAYVCRKTWANTFTGGISSGAGAVIETSFSRGVSEPVSESNGFQIEFVYMPVSGGAGMQWDAKSGEPSVSWTFGPGLGAKFTASGDYTHTWAETGNVVACDKMTWGPAWKSL